MTHNVTNLGAFNERDGLVKIDVCGDGNFRTGKDGVVGIYTGDRKVEFIDFGTHTLAYVASAIGYPAYYPVKPVSVEKPIKAVLMDLDGTSVRSEEFWIWIIQKTVASLLGDDDFALDKADLPLCRGTRCPSIFNTVLTNTAPTKTCKRRANCTSSTRITK